MQSSLKEPTKSQVRPLSTSNNNSFGQQQRCAVNTESRDDQENYCQLKVETGSDSGKASKLPKFSFTRDLSIQTSDSCISPYSSDGWLKPAVFYTPTAFDSDDFSPLPYAEEMFEKTSEALSPQILPHFQVPVQEMPSEVEMAADFLEDSLVAVCNEQDINNPPQNNQSYDETNEDCVDGSSTCDTDHNSHNPFLISFQQVTAALNASLNLSSSGDNGSEIAENSINYLDSDEKSENVSHHGMILADSDSFVNECYYHVDKKDSDDHFSDHETIGSLSDHNRQSDENKDGDNINPVECVTESNKAVNNEFATPFELNSEVNENVEDNGIKFISRTPDDHESSHPFIVESEDEVGEEGVDAPSFVGLPALSESSLEGNQTSSPVNDAKISFQSNSAEAQTVMCEEIESPDTEPEEQPSLFLEALKQTTEKMMETNIDIACYSSENDDASFCSFLSHASEDSGNFICPETEEEIDSYIHSMTPFVRNPDHRHSHSNVDYNQHLSPELNPKTNRSEDEFALKYMDSDIISVESSQEMREMIPTEEVPLSANRELFCEKNMMQAGEELCSAQLDGQIDGSPESGMVASAEENYTEHERTSLITKQNLVSESEALTSDMAGFDREHTESVTCESEFAPDLSNVSLSKIFELVENGSSCEQELHDLICDTLDNSLPVPLISQIMLVMHFAHPGIWSRRLATDYSRLVKLIIQNDENVFPEGAVYDETTILQYCYLLKQFAEARDALEGNPLYSDRLSLVMQYYDSEFRTGPEELKAAENLFTQLHGEVSTPSYSFEGMPEAETSIAHKITWLTIRLFDRGNSSNSKVGNVPHLECALSAFLSEERSLVIIKQSSSSDSGDIFQEFEAKFGPMEEVDESEHAEIFLRRALNLQATNQGANENSDIDCDRIQDRCSIDVNEEVEDVSPEIPASKCKEFDCGVPIDLIGEGNYPEVTSMDAQRFILRPSKTSETDSSKALIEAASDLTSIAVQVDMKSDTEIHAPENSEESQGSEKCRSDDKDETNVILSKNSYLIQSFSEFEAMKTLESALSTCLSVDGVLQDIKESMSADSQDFVQNSEDKFGPMEAVDESEQAQCLILRLSKTNDSASSKAMNDTVGDVGPIEAVDESEQAQRLILRLSKTSETASSKAMIDPVGDAKHEIKSIAVLVDMKSGTEVHASENSEEFLTLSDDKDETNVILSKNSSLIQSFSEFEAMKTLESALSTCLSLDDILKEIKESMSADSQDFVQNPADKFGPMEAVDESEQAQCLILRLSKTNDSASSKAMIDTVGDAKHEIKSIAVLVDTKSNTEIHVSENSEEFFVLSDGKDEAKFSFRENASLIQSFSEFESMKTLESAISTCLSLDDILKEIKESVSADSQDISQEKEGTLVPIDGKRTVGHAEENADVIDFQHIPTASKKISLKNNMDNDGQDSPSHNSRDILLDYEEKFGPMQEIDESEMASGFLNRFLALKAGGHFPDANVREIGLPDPVISYDEGDQSCIEVDLVHGYVRKDLFVDIGGEESSKQCLRHPEGIEQPLTAAGTEQRSCQSPCSDNHECPDDCEYAFLDAREDESNKEFRITVSDIREGANESSNDMKRDTHLSVFHLTKTSTFNIDLDEEKVSSAKIDDDKVSSANLDVDVSPIENSLSMVSSLSFFDFECQTKPKLPSEIAFQKDEPSLTPQNKNNRLVNPVFSVWKKLFSIEERLQKRELQQAKMALQQHGVIILGWESPWGNQSSSHLRALTAPNPFHINGVAAAAHFVRRRCNVGFPVPSKPTQIGKRKVKYCPASEGLDVFSFRESLSRSYCAQLDRLPWEKRIVGQRFLSEKSLETRNWFGSFALTRGNDRCHQPISHPLSVELDWDIIPYPGSWKETWFTPWQAFRANPNNLIIDQTISNYSEDDEEVLQEPPQIGVLTTIRQNINERLTRVSYAHTSNLRRSRWRQKFYPRDSFPY